ncbi:MAG: flippase-like domain-containing protein [Acidobacteria bacterium]|nr:flippase-like domain-containing protein [Acidobacteriota bacterium]
MNSKTKPQSLNPNGQNPKNAKNLLRLKILGAVLTLLGLGLFAYFVYSVGIGEILKGIVNIGFGGFVFIIFIYFLRIVMRASAWRLCVAAPHKLRLSDTLPAVIIGEALSSLIPLGILISGTSKVVAVRNRVPLVVGLSSVATENLFYSFVTGLFIIFGAIAFLFNSELEESWVVMIYGLISLIFALIVFALLAIIRQWHLLSNFCSWLYNKHFGRGILENGRGQALLFENLIFGFYRQYPRRFAPIFLFQILFHALGVLEVWFILSRISTALPSLNGSFLLESISRLITIVFKLVPFLIGVDEAGAQIITETLALGAGVGVTIGIIRKSRILFWTAIGLILIFTRGVSIREITELSSQQHVTKTG